MTRGSGETSADASSRRLPSRRPRGENRREVNPMGSKMDFGLKGKSRDSYLGLISEFPLASIKSEAHLAEAQKVMDELLAKGKLDGGEEMYLDALSDLAAAYEDTHHP